MRECSHGRHQVGVQQREDGDRKCDEAVGAQSKNTEVQIWSFAERQTSLIGAWEEGEGGGEMRRKRQAGVRVQDLEVMRRNVSFSLRAMKSH